MARRLGNQSETAEGLRAKLEHRYQFDRKPLESRLRTAIDQQREVNEFIGTFSRESRGWKREAHRFEIRRRKTLRAGTAFKSEIESCSWFDAFTKRQLQARMNYVTDLIDQVLKLRVAAATALELAARGSTLRGRGRPGEQIVDACLKSLVDELSSPRGSALPKEMALQYVAAMAQSEGKLDRESRDPAGALRRRLKTHGKRPAVVSRADYLVAFRGALGVSPTGGEWPAPGATVDEALRQAREIVAGRSWPWPALGSHLADAGPRRVRFMTAEQERFNRLEAVLLSHARSPSDQS